MVLEEQLSTLEKQRSDLKLILLRMETELSKIKAAPDTIHNRNQVVKHYNRAKSAIVDLNQQIKEVKTQIRGREAESLRIYKEEKAAAHQKWLEGAETRKAEQEQKRAERHLRWLRETTPQGTLFKRLKRKILGDDQ